MSGYDASEWKAGDVGILDYKFAKGGLAMRVDKCGDHEFRGPHWHFANGDRGDGSGAYRIRPLVVIDPEDAEQVGRLLHILRPGTPSGLFRLQAALREFVRPTPRIEEPQGLGAVVEDAKGLVWVRVEPGLDNSAVPMHAWRNRVPHAEARVVSWLHVDAVRILSPGVTP